MAEAAGALPLAAALVDAATRGVEEATGADEMSAEEGFLVVEMTRVGEDVIVGVKVELTSVVLVLISELVLVGVGVLVLVLVLVGVWVGVEVDVGVGVAEIVTGIQFRSSWARVPDGVTVPAEAWQEA